MINTKKPYLYAILIAVSVLFLFYTVIIPSQFYQTIRLKSMDFVYTINNSIFPISQEQLKDVAIVVIDDETLRTVDMPWPWKRVFFAEMIEKLNAYNPKIIYLNLPIFIGEVIGEAEGNQVFAATIRNNGNVILPSYYDSEMHLVAPLDILTDAARKVGFVNKKKDIDGGIRRFYPAHISEGGVIDNYAVEINILSSFYDLDEEETLSRLRIPVRRDGSAYISYLAPPEKFQVYSLTQIFTDQENEIDLKDKIVILGNISEIAHDIYRTPIGTLSGVYIVANTLLALSSGRFIGEANMFLLILLYALVAIGFGWLVFFRGPRKGFLAFIPVSLVIFLSSIGLFRLGIILDYFSPIFIAAITSITTAFYRYIVVLKDHIQKLEIANIEIKNAQNEIVRREQLSTIGKLTSQIVHEMNNPIGSIISFLDLLKRTKEPQETGRILDLTYKEILRARRIGEDLKTSYTPHVENLVPTDINQLIEELVETSAQKLKDKNIETKLGLDRSLSQINVSPDKIRQVFTNMILNAADALKPGGHISITTRIYNKEWADIVFKDDGCGISEEELPKIFNAFHTSKKGYKKGTGLGLFISYEIVKAHKGKILVESKVGEGTTFTIKLPLTT